MNASKSHRNVSNKKQTKQFCRIVTLTVNLGLRREKFVGVFTSLNDELISCGMKGTYINEAVFKG